MNFSIGPLEDFQEKLVQLNDQHHFSLVVGINIILAPLECFASFIRQCLFLCLVNFYIYTFWYDFTGC